MRNQWSHDIAGQKRTVTGQLVYSTRRTHSVPSEAQKDHKVTREDIQAMRLFD